MVIMEPLGEIILLRVLTNLVVRHLKLSRLMFQIVRISRELLFVQSQGISLIPLIRVIINFVSVKIHLLSLKQILPIGEAV